MGMNKSVERDCRMVVERGVVFVDCETSGLGSRDVIIDLALVDISGRVLFESLIKLPFSLNGGGVIINEKAFAIHGISYEMLESAGVAFSEAWRGFHKALIRSGALTVVSFNVEFDYRMLGQTVLAANDLSVYDSWVLASGLVDWQCAMLTAQKYFGLRKWPKLDEATDRLDIKSVVTHRAAADAERCRQVWLKMAGVA